MNGNIYFLVEPLGGQRFVNTKNKIIINISIEDHTFTQRVGVVKHLPKFYKGNVEIGDMLVVHHNTFRTYYDQNGNRKESFNHIKDSLFYVGEEFVYMIIKPNGQKYAFNNNVFVEPIKSKPSFFEEEQEIQHLGKIYLTNDDLIEQNINNGDTVIYAKDSEYEFYLGKERLYKMTTNRILAKV